MSIRIFKTVLGLVCGCVVADMATSEAWAGEGSQQKTWAIVVHGGAGTVSKDAAPETVQAWRDGLRVALEKGKSIVEAGGTSLDAVEATIRILEDNPLFNAGKGAVFNSAGGHELDSSIMDGSSLDGGAVAGVTTVKNPISLARRVMDETRFCPDLMRSIGLPVQSRRVPLVRRA